MSAKRGKTTDFFTKVRAKLSCLTYIMYNQNTLGYNAVVGLPNVGSVAQRPYCHVMLMGVMRVSWTWSELASEFRRNSAEINWSENYLVKEQHLIHKSNGKTEIISIEDRSYMSKTLSMCIPRCSSTRGVRTLYIAWIVFPWFVCVRCVCTCVLWCWGKNSKLDLVTTP